MEQKIPVFKETAGTLSAQIRERNFAPGTAQPSENELCRRYSISCFPVQKALSLLEADDLIVRQPGASGQSCVNIPADTRAVSGEVRHLPLPVRPQRTAFPVPGHGRDDTPVKVPAPSRRLRRKNRAAEPSKRGR